MKVRYLLKEIVKKNRILAWLYNVVYINFLIWKRRNVYICDNGVANVVQMPKNTYSDDLKITFNGNNNKIIIGKGCVFKQTNKIYIQGDQNVIEIGNNVIFDQNVSIVVAEGTRCFIGSGSIFANGVRIRTSDQHIICDEKGKRINLAKNVYIGNHVWLGASVIIMKGVRIGDGSVVGIDSMVTKDVPPKSIIVGNPARVIRTNITWYE